MTSAHKFIQKFWILVNQISLIDKKQKLGNNKEIEIFSNQAIERINVALEKFRYNVIIAVFHDIYSFFKKIAEEDKNFENLKVNFIKILITMMPVIPHIINESLEKFKSQKEVKWPIVNQKYMETDQKEIVIQINGKKRNSILVEKDIPEKKLIEIITQDKLIEKYTVGKKIFKTIYVKNRIINFIIK